MERYKMSGFATRFLVYTYIQCKPRKGFGEFASAVYTLYLSLSVHIQLIRTLLEANIVAKW